MALTGRARGAIEAYVAAFRDGRIDVIEAYTADEGPPETVKHGRFTLDGQPMVAMDSHGDHRFTFTEGISLQVMCADQDEVDHHWRALSEGGEKGPCGWLKDCEMGPNRTRLVLIDGPYDEAMAPNAETGWSQSLDKLERQLAG